MKIKWRSNEEYATTAIRASQLLQSMVVVPVCLQWSGCSPREEGGSGKDGESLLQQPHQLGMMLLRRRSWRWCCWFFDFDGLRILHIPCRPGFVLFKQITEARFYRYILNALSTVSEICDGQQQLYTTRLCTHILRNWWRHSSVRGYTDLFWWRENMKVSVESVLSRTTWKA